MREYNIWRTIWNQLLTLIGLNLLFWLLCLPVVTFPAAITALNCACRHCLDDRGDLFSVFFRCFRRNLFAAIPYGILALVGAGGFLYGTLFYYRLGSDSLLFLTLSVFCLIAFYLLSVMMGLVFQLLSLEEKRFGNTLKLAAGIVLGDPALLFTWLLLAFAAFALCIWFLPHSLPLLTLLGAALPALFTAKAVLPKIETEDQ